MIQAKNRFLVVLCIIMVTLFTGCENTASKGITNLEHPVELEEVNPFEPDHRAPENEMDGYRLVFNDEFNHEGPMKTEYWNA